MTTAVDAQVPDLMRSIAAYGLQGSHVRLPDQPLADEDWSRLVRQVLTGKLIGLLAIAIDNGDLSTTPEQRGEIAELHVAAMSHSLQLERLLLGIADTLDHAGVPFRVLKGSAVARLDYEDPCLRPFVDVDLLVRSDDFARAVGLLEAAGIRRIWRSPREGFDRRFGKGATLVTADGYEVDLHRTFVSGPWGLTVTLSDLWQPGRDIELAGRVLQTLSDEARLLHAAMHAVLGHELSTPYLASRDVAEMILFGRIDRVELLAMARRWQVEAVLAEAITLAWTMFQLADITALSAWAETYQTTDLDQRRRAVYRQATGSYTAKSVASLQALPRMRDRMSFLLDLAFPSGQFLTDRGLSRRAWMRRGMSRAVHPSRQSQ